MQDVEVPAAVDPAAGLRVDEPVAPTGRQRTFAARLFRNKVTVALLSVLALLHVIVFVGPLFWRLAPDNADPLLHEEHFDIFQPRRHR